MVTNIGVSTAPSNAASAFRERPCANELTNCATEENRITVNAVNQRKLCSDAHMQAHFTRTNSCLLGNVYPLV